jgi:hypothetical protein
MDKDLELFGTKGAADLLGVTPQTVRRHVHVEGDLEPDLLVGGRFMVFCRETLDAYLEDREPDTDRAPDLFSTRDAAEYLGVGFDAVDYHVHRADNLEPDAKVAGRLIFTRETLDAFKRRKR